MIRTIDSKRLPSPNGFQVYPTTLANSQTIPSGYQSLLYGPITIPSGVTLTIGGALWITNPVLAAA